MFTHNYRQYFKNRQFILSAVVGFLLMFLSFYLNFHAGTYANNSESNSVTDIVLSNIRVYDVDGIFVYGAGLFWIVVIGLCLLRPNRIPFATKSIALFVIVRSIFISLTHIGVFPNHLIVDHTKLFSAFSFEGDLFFSGHTGLPFLMALLFWDNKILRYLFIATSIMFGIVVLLAHLHYSIDVLSAFFITYGIYKIAERFFKADKKVFDVGIQQLP